MFLIDPLVVGGDESLVVVGDEPLAANGDELLVVDGVELMVEDWGAMLDVDGGEDEDVMEEGVKKLVCTDVRVPWYRVFLGRIQFVV